MSPNSPTLELKILLSPFYRWRKWGPRRLSHILKLTVSSGKARTHIRDFWDQNPTPSPCPRQVVFLCAVELHRELSRGQCLDVSPDQSKLNLGFYFNTPAPAPKNVWSVTRVENCCPGLQDSFNSGFAPVTLGKVLLPSVFPQFLHLPEWIMTVSPSWGDWTR